MDQNSHTLSQRSNVLLLKNWHCMRRERVKFKTCAITAPLIIALTLSSTTEISLVLILLSHVINPMCHVNSGSRLQLRTGDYKIMERIIESMLTDVSKKLFILKIQSLSDFMDNVKDGRRLQLNSSMSVADMLMLSHPSESIYARNVTVKDTLIVVQALVHHRVIQALHPVIVDVERNIRRTSVATALVHLAQSVDVVQAQVLALNVARRRKRSVATVHLHLAQSVDVKAHLHLAHRLHQVLNVVRRRKRSVVILQAHPHLAQVQALVKKKIAGLSHSKNWDTTTLREASAVLNLVKTVAKCKLLVVQHVLIKSFVPRRVTLNVLT
jgi:hypothetical protein